MRKLLTFLILFIVLSVWFILSVIRTFNNYLHFPSELKVWMLSDNEKNKIAYGDVYFFSKQIINNTANNSDIYYIDSDLNNKQFYLSRYLIYPRKLYLVNKVPINRNDGYIISRKNKEDKQGVQLNKNWYLYLIHD